MRLEQFDELVGATAGGFVTADLSVKVFNTVPQSILQNLLDVQFVSEVSFKLGLFFLEVLDLLAQLVNLSGLATTAEQERGTFTRLQWTTGETGFVGCLFLQTDTLEESFVVGLELSKGGFAAFSVFEEFLELET